MNTQVILGKERNKIILIDIVTNLKWANELFSSVQQAEDFCEVNGLELIDLFERYELLPQEVQKIILEFGECESYEECKQLIAILETVGYTADFGLDASPGDLIKLI